MSFRSRAAVLPAAITLAAIIIPVTASARMSPAAPKWRPVTYRGVTIRVPAGWPVVDLGKHPGACPRLDVHAVYLGTPGPDPACPAGLTGRADSVLVTPLRPGDPDVLAASHRLTGQQVSYAGADWRTARTITEVLPGASLKVSIYYRAGTATARTIAASIRIGRSARPASTGALAGRAAATVQAGLAQGVYSGPGFDACTAPSLAAMNGWLTSKYRAIGVYIGGVNRGCPQANLTASWLAAIQAQGWHYFPIYVGLQAACVLANGDAAIDGKQAAAQGTAAADDAAAQAQNLGIAKGTPLIFDMEAYGPACDPQVTKFLGAWDTELHARGYNAGVYESFTNVGALVTAASTITLPDVMYYADWDGQATTASAYMPAGRWTNHQRIHQYLGDHVETYGGVAINIDSDQLDVGLGNAGGSGGSGGSGGTPPASSHAGFRISVAINSNGTAEWFARTASGQLAHAWQAPVGGLTWSTARLVGQSPTGLTSNPAAVAQASGALAVFATGSDGRIRPAWQQAGFPNGWHWGTPLPAAPGAALAGTDPAAVRLPSGPVAVFSTMTGGNVVMASQASANSSARWTGWTSLGGNCASTPVLIVDSRRNVDLFCVTAGSTIGLNTWNGSAWSGWSYAGSIPANLIGVPAAVVNAAGQTEFIAATTDGALDYAWQDGLSGLWTWTLGLGGTAAGVTGSPAAVAWPGGQVAVYARLGTGQPGVITQLGGTGLAPWGTWSAIGGAAGGGMLGSPAAWLNRGGAPEVAVLDGSLRIATAYLSAGRWTAWSELPGGF